MQRKPQSMNLNNELLRLKSMLNDLDGDGGILMLAEHAQELAGA